MSWEAIKHTKLKLEMIEQNSTKIELGDNTISCLNFHEYWNKK